MLYTSLHGIWKQANTYQISKCMYVVIICGGSLRQGPGHLPAPQSGRFGG